jgi:hypothetical protein
MKGRLAALLALATVTIPTAQERAPQNESIRKEDMRPDVYFLASDAMRGRLTATPENGLAAAWVASRFERLGLKPVGGSYYQTYNLMTATLGRENSLEIASAGRPSVRLGAGQDFYPQRFSISGRVKAPVVFAGFGMLAPAFGHDDYRGDQIKGKVVLVLDHEPGERDPNSPFDGVVPSLASRHPIHKALYAQEKGAVGILYVTDVHNHPGPDNFEAAARNFWPATPPRIERYELASWMERVAIPSAQISPALARTILRGTGRSLEDLAKAAEAAGGLAPVEVPGIEVDLTAGVDRHIVPDQNVLAAIEGSDPRLRNEWVVICAHFDHNGADAAQVFNGADDDASGMAALIDIAEAYALAAQNGRRPKRSVLFAAWNSEERGLAGAFAFTESPLVPLANIAAVLNMDMIGRNEEVPVGGGGRFRGLEIQTAEQNQNAMNLIGYTYSPDLVAIVEAANKPIGLELKKRYDNNASELLRRSDHWPFLQHRVPALFFHTGLHPDYHTQYDRPEKVNYDKMEKIARLVHQASWDLAERADRPRFVPRYGSTPTARR